MLLSIKSKSTKNGYHLIIILSTILNIVFYKHRITIKHL